MNKKEFARYISDEYSCTVTEANRIIDLFTNSVISGLSEGKDISLTGFGLFSVSKIPARDGRNPKTGEPLKIAAYNQPKFKAGQKLKDSVNNE